MININNKPFLYSLEQAATQTDDYREFEALLKEQKRDFRDYVEEFFLSDLAAHKRFYFLKIIEDKLYEIHRDFGDSIRDSDERFFQFWIKMIDDAQRFVNIGVETLQFQVTCPAHMLAEEKTRTFPLCNWTANRSDLMEAIVGIYHADVVRLKDGSRPSFAVFVKEIGNIFGITFNNPYEYMRKILIRKKSQTPFINRMIAAIMEKIADMNK